MLETRQLTKAFGGVRAVDDLSVQVEPGVVTALVGPNGSGKTTLVNLLSGMLPFDGGAVVVGGAGELRRIKPHQLPDHGITRTFQEVRLFEQMTVLDNLLVVLTSARSFRRCSSGRSRGTSSVRGRCWRAPAWPTRSTSSRARCPTGSAS